MKTYIILNGDFVKIGRSLDPERRLRELQTGSPASYSIGAVYDGDREAELHARFKEHHERGEWFKKCPEILGFIESEPRGDYHVREPMPLFADEWRRRSAFADALSGALGQVREVMVSALSDPAFRGAATDPETICLLEHLAAYADAIFVAAQADLPYVMRPATAGEEAERDRVLAMLNETIEACRRMEQRDAELKEIEAAAPLLDQQELRRRLVQYRAKWELPL